MRIQREGFKLPPVNVYKGGIQRHLLAQLWPQGCFISGHLAAPRVICPEPKLLGATRLPNKTPAHKRPQRCPQAQPQTGAHMLTSPQNCPQAKGRAQRRPRKTPATPTPTSPGRCLQRPQAPAGPNSTKLPASARKEDSRIKTTTLREHRPQRPARTPLTCEYLGRSVLDPLTG